MSLEQRAERLRALNAEIGKLMAQAKTLNPFALRPTLEMISDKQNMLNQEVQAAFADIAEMLGGENADR